MRLIYPDGRRANIARLVTDRVRSSPMTPAAERLLVQAMRLHPSDRAELFDRMAESVDPGEPSHDPAYAAEWEAELAARIDQIDRGEVEMIPWEQVRDELGRGGSDGAG